MNLYKNIFSQLGKAEIEYLIVGGVAVNLYGYSRFTGDIDILLALNSENLSKMDKIMHKLGYVERLPVKIKELGDVKKLKTFIKKKGLKTYTFISNSKPQLDIDVIVEESLDFNKYKKRKRNINVWGMNLPVVNINDLIKMKRAIKRDKDLIDLEALLKLKES